MPYHAYLSFILLNEYIVLYCRISDAMLAAMDIVKKQV